MYAFTFTIIIVVIIDELFRIATCYDQESGSGIKAIGYFGWFRAFTSGLFHYIF
jgi:hypothetical protein